MEIDPFLMDSFRDVGYEGPMLDEDKLKIAIQGGVRNVEFTEFVTYFTNEIRLYSKIDEEVNPIGSPEDCIPFLLELTSFLKEIGCPYERLTLGHLSNRLASNEDKILLLEYLTTELMTNKMIAANNPEKTLDLKLNESSTAADLKQILLALKFSKPPDNITTPMLFQKVVPKLQETVRVAGKDLVGKPLLNGTLTEQQWAEIEKVHNNLDKDYTIRREMLLKRLDCTIQSFQWSANMKGNEDQIMQIFHDKRRNLSVDPGVSISDLLAAREDLAVMEKTSNASVRKNTQSAINKHIIGQVPDRGGRTSEQAPPPPEMPSWQQRSAGGRGGGRGGGGNYQQHSNFDNRRGNQHNTFDNTRGNQHYTFDNRRGNQPNTYDSPRGGGYNNQSQASYDNRGGYNQSSYDNRGHNQPQPSFEYRGGYNPQQAKFDSRGGYNQPQPSFDNRGGYNQSQPNYDNRSGGYDTNRSSGGNNDYNRGGNQGGRSYDSFQHNKGNYADQYVQDNQQNRQYSGRGDYNNSRGSRRGRSNYNRGNY